MTQISSAPSQHPTGPAAPTLARQLVSFAFFKLDPAFRRLPAGEKATAREEFLAQIAPPQGMICLSYSTVGMRPDVDFMLWRISYNPDDFQTHSAAINKTRLGAYLTTPHAFLSMTKRSVYVQDLDPFHTPESRSHLRPGQRKFLFVYPFVKTREWYLLPMERRQEMMNQHIRIGNEFPSVKLNTTYSFGLDDQEFVVAFETNEPKDFLDLVMKLRETEASRYTLRDTPIFTCVQRPIGGVMDQLF